MRIRLSTALLAYGLEGPSASSTVDNLNPQGIHTWSPLFAKPSIDDGKKVKIAAIHSDSQ
jgi:hypothetical protein